jgi:ferredoxin-NADP reductase
MDQGNKELRVCAIQEEIPGFKTFMFEDTGVSYKAGQYLTFIMDHAGDEVRRSYSITSAPALNEPLSIGVKRKENGVFSRYLCDTVKVGDTLTATGAGGLFTLPANDEPYEQVFFFAAGSGITPVFSLIKEVLYSRPHLRIVLVYSNAAKQRTIFLNELQSLQALFSDRFVLHFLFSNTPDLFHAHLHRDLLLRLLADYITANRSKILFYTCGPESYMRFCIYTLQEAGFDKNNIKRETFLITKVRQPAEAIPDKETHTAYIVYGQERYDVEVSYPDSILKAARRKGISLPYSCEAGQCGNCVARCLSGTIWHSINEVLTDKELEQGLVLTCVGHPVGGDVVLEIGLGT